MAVDAGPQTHRSSLRFRDKFLFHHWWLDGRVDTAESADTWRRACVRGYIQQDVLHPRHHHGLLLPGAGSSSGAGEFPDTPYDRGQGCCLSEAQSAELVPVYHRRLFRAVHDDFWLRGYGLDVYHAIEH